MRAYFKALKRQEIKLKLPKSPKMEAEKKYVSRQADWQKQKRKEWRAANCCATCGKLVKVGQYRCTKCNRARRDAASALMRKRREAARGEIPGAVGMNNFVELPKA